MKNMKPIEGVNYIIDYVKLYDIDYFIPIARKGIRSLQLSPRISEIQEKIVFFDALLREFHRFLCPKKILVDRLLFHKRL